MEIKTPESAFWKGKKVFVTGHTGFKGSWLCMLLKHLGAEVYGYALNPPTTPSLYNLCHIDSDVTSVIGDIRDFEKLKKSIVASQAEILIHMAAQPLVRYSYQNPVETYEVNVMGTVNVLEAIKHSSTIKSVVVVTTDKCYENKEWPWSYRENEPMGGFDPYSSSKGCAELVTAAFRNSFFSSQSKVCLASARAGNVIGGGDWAMDRLIPDFIRAMQKHEKIVIRSPKAIRPWQHVLEPLTGYLVLAEALYNDKKYSEAWNFGPNDEDAKTVEWIVKKLCEKWGNNSSYEIDKNPNLHEATFLKLDCSKAKHYLGWYPRWTLEKTLDSIVAFAKTPDVELKNICISQIETYLKSAY
jgi:CDP-glucose 4,6-dehydratase